MDSQQRHQHRVIQGIKRLSKERYVRLSALSSELLTREYDELSDPGAFGRLAQEIIVAAIKKVHPGAHDNRGAGTPDCKYNAGGVAWAWEIKHDVDGKLTLGDRDIEGIMADRNASDHRPRLLILDMRFPVSIWCLDASVIRSGEFNIDANTHLQQYSEAAELAEHVNTILRRCDVDLLGPEEHAKRLVQKVAGG